MTALYNAIVADLKKHEDKEGAEYAKRWHKYEYHSYGMFAADMRNVFKQHKKEIQALSCKDALALARKLHSSHIEEQVQAANYVLQQKIDCITPAQFGYLDKALGHFSSWSQVDDICVEGGKVIASLRIGEL
ncbi:MAG TPA: DNA alkylation repair protein [Candidatus Paceibacterota bacterium]